MTERATARHIVYLIELYSRGAATKQAQKNLQAHLPVLLMANLHIIRKALITAPSPGSSPAGRSPEYRTGSRKRSGALHGIKKGVIAEATTCGPLSTRQMREHPG